MKKYLLIIVLGVSSYGYSALPPYPVTRVKESYTEENSKDLAKYKLVFSNSTDNSNLKVLVKNITLCSTNRCYNSPNTKSINIKNMIDGKPSVNSITYLIPRKEVINSIYFEPHSNSRFSISGSITIKDTVDLKISELPHGVDIFVNLERKNNNLVPYYASSMFNTANANNIFYDKNIGITANLNYGTKLNIPKHSLNESQIFNIFINNDGEKYPSLDIYPNVKFNIPVQVIRKNLDNPILDGLEEVLNTNMPKSAPLASSKLSNVSMLQDKTTTEDTLLINNTGFISSSSRENSSSRNVRSSISTLATTETCGAELARLSKQLISQTSTSGVVNIDLCKNKPPYVHIALINKLHPKIGYLVEHEPATTQPLDPSSSVLAVPMYRLDAFNSIIPRAIVSINGFTWDGPPGIIPNTLGRPLGYVSSSKTYDNKVDKVKPIGINRKMGGTVLLNTYPGSEDGKKFVMHHRIGSSKVAFFESSKILGAFSGGPENVVSSSTSILKNNTCNSGSVDRWSSIGASDALMVMISTASDKESNSADFCEIYRAFGITNALRLDGGGSTSMIVNNKLLNPNTGSKRVVFGEMRHIPYALKAYGK